MGRLEYQRRWATGRIVNLGCRDDPARFGAPATHVDIDEWDLPNFVRADITQRLPFADGSFDTAVLGDVLEHVLDPEAAVREAARVARRIVLTIPEDVSLPHGGPHVEIGRGLRAADYRRQLGLGDDVSDDEAIARKKLAEPGCRRVTPESEVPHDGHINRFDEAWVDRLIALTGMSVVDKRKEPEVTTYLTWDNWLITLERHNQISPLRGWTSVFGWLDPAEGRTLQQAVHSTPAGSAIVEVGTWCGRSLICLAQARAAHDPSRPLVSVDLYPETGQAQAYAAGTDPSLTPARARSLSEEALRAFGVTDVHRFFVDGVAGAAAFRAALPGQKVGVLFLDDHHEGGHVLDELEAWLPLLAEHAEVCLHDFFHDPYQIERAAWEFIRLHPEWWLVETALMLARLRRDRPAPPPRAAPATLRTSATARFQICGAVGPARPKVSALCYTYRVGGLDALKIGLDRQTMPPDDFEAVLVDHLYEYRREAVACYFAQAPYRVVHVAPHPNPFPRDAGNLARNAALRHAAGDVVVWWCDYTAAEELCLQRHYDNVLRHRGRIVSCGTHVYANVSPAALHPAFRAALPFADVDAYVDWLNALPADSPLWISIFARDPRELGRAGTIGVLNGHGFPYEAQDRVYPSTDPSTRGDPKLFSANGPVDSGFFYAKNEAIARGGLVAINGWEETFDDGHCADDSNLADRLRQAGFVFMNDKGCESFVLNPRPFFPRLRWARTPIDNHDLYRVIQSEDTDRGELRARRGLVARV